MIAFEDLPTPPPGTHWEKRDYVVGGETWCVVRDGIHGAIVSRVPVAEMEREAMRVCVEFKSGSEIQGIKVTHVDTVRVVYTGLSWESPGIDPFDAIEDMIKNQEEA